MSNDALMPTFDHHLCHPRLASTAAVRSRRRRRCGIFSRTVRSGRTAVGGQIAAAGAAVGRQLQLIRMLLEQLADVAAQAADRELAKERSMFSGGWRRRRYSIAVIQQHQGTGVR